MDKFKNDLVEVIHPTYLLGFTDTIDVAAKSLSEENVAQLRMPDSYNPDAKKLAGIIAKGLMDRADLQEEERKFNDWTESIGVEDDKDKDGGDDNAEARVRSRHSCLVGVLVLRFRTCKKNLKFL